MSSSRAAFMGAGDELPRARWQELRVGGPLGWMAAAGQGLACIGRSGVRCVLVRALHLGPLRGSEAGGPRRLGRLLGWGAAMAKNQAGTEPWLHRSARQTEKAFDRRCVRGTACLMSYPRPEGRQRGSGAFADWRLCFASACALAQPSRCVRGFLSASGVCGTSFLGVA